MKEEQHSSISDVDAAGCTYSHIVVIPNCSISANSSKTHIVVVAYEVNPKVWTD